MHKPFLQAAFGRGVRLSCQPHQALAEKVRFQGLVRGDQDVDAQVVFETAEEVGAGEVLGDQVTILLRHLVLFPDHPDPFAATRGNRLKYIKILIVVHLSVIAPSFVILGENIRLRTYFELFAELSPQFLDIAPQARLAANCPGAREVVYLLVLVHRLQARLLDEWRPHNITTSGPIALRDQIESSGFECVYDAIVCVRLGTYFE